MSKKHFEALAAALREQVAAQSTSAALDGNYGCVVAVEDAARRISDVCARFNPNFDRARFLKACGVQESN